MSNGFNKWQMAGMITLAVLSIMFLFLKVYVVPAETGIPRITKETVEKCSNATMTRFDMKNHPEDAKILSDLLKFTVIGDEQGFENYIEELKNETGTNGTRLFADAYVFHVKCLVDNGVKLGWNKNTNRK